MSKRAVAGRLAFSVCLVGLLVPVVSGCRENNAYAPPPPPEVGVALPVARAVTPYVETTGTVAAFNSVDLQARVQGFVQEIDFKDGQRVTAEQPLFLIEPEPYEARLAQAQAALDAAQAQFAQSDAEFNRQASLGQKDFASRSTVDQARATRDANKANIENQEAAVRLARINLDYTKVKAPFDGIVTSHLVSVGSLVGITGPTTLASVVQLDPIYVNFTLSEQAVQKIRTMLRDAGVAEGGGRSAPIEVGLMSEQGHPHSGTIDYMAPKVDPATGTLSLRGLLANPDNTLLPGYFVRIRIPGAALASRSLLVPDAVLGTNQAGRYLLVVNGDGIVEQRMVTAGQLDGDLRVVSGQLKPDDRVVIDGLSRVVPGEKVVARPVPMPGA
jgi:RND family efflux transporter MFP subunit